MKRFEAASTFSVQYTTFTESHSVQDGYNKPHALLQCICEDCVIAKHKYSCNNTCFLFIMIIIIIFFCSF